MKKITGVKVLSLGLALSLLAAPLPAMAAGIEAGTALAAETPAKVNGAANQSFQSGMSLERAIELAKQKLTIPEKLDKFSSNYSESNNRASWYLRWNSSSSPEGSFSVTVSADSGEITGIDYYTGNPPGLRYSGLPKYNRQQGLELAKKTAEAMLPDKYRQTVEAPFEQPEIVYLRTRDYPVIYNFRFVRTEGGIPVSNQGINVGINGETGELANFNCQWDDQIELPSADGGIGIDKARELFLEKAGYELTYFLPRKGWDGDQYSDLRLVYRMKPPGRHFLNALTGEFIDMRNTYIDSFDMNGMGGMEKSMSSDMKQELTPAENKEVEQTKDMLSGDEALAKARLALDIPKAYNNTGKNLDRNYEVPNSRVWRLSFGEGSDKNGLAVTLDAYTGELQGFNKFNYYSKEDYYKEPVVKVSQDQAIKIAQEIAARLQPEKFSQVILRQVDPEWGPLLESSRDQGPKSRSYNIFYARQINGIVYPENGFRIRVDTTTGEVTNYDMIWWETDFPAPEGVMELASVNNKLLQENPLKLTYARSYPSWGRDDGKTPKHYLVYHLSRGIGEMVDAKSGVEIDYQGNPVVKKDQTFKDIENHPAKEDIKLLAGEGIVKGSDGLYRPGDNITTAELCAMLVKADQEPYRWFQELQEPWEKQYMEAARAMGILDKDDPAEPGSLVTRLNFARMAVNAQGHGKLASNWEIFKLNVADQGSVPQSQRGFVAAALALGIMTQDMGSFNGEMTVDRGEAASMLVKMLKSR